MAYDTSNPPALIAQRVGAARGAVWFYVDGDDQGTIGASGYISNGHELGMKAGDIVNHIDTANNVTNVMTVVDHTKGTASGAACSAIEPIGETSIALDSVGTGTILEDDVITFSNDPDSEYRVTAGDADVSNGGTLTITPGLVKATAVGTAITVKSNVKKLRGQSVAGAITLDEARTLTAADSGSVIYLALAGGFTVTLPAPAEGLKFKFVVKVAPTTAYVIVTNGGDNIMIGGVNELEVDTADDGPYDDNADTLNFVANVAAKGDFVEFDCDGTSWYYRGQTNLDGGITTSTT
jgi:hypothetical protein